MLCGLTPIAAASTHRAGLVVTDTAGHTHVKCVPFTGASITGLQLLSRAGFSTTIEQSSIGSAICSVNGGGCTSTTNCFCHYPKFWGYWTRAPDATKWKFSDVGAQIRKVRDGSIDGWVWGRDGGPAPRLLSLDAICAASGTKTLTKPTRSNYVAFGFLVLAIAIAGVVLAIRRSR